MIARIIPNLAGRLPSATPGATRRWMRAAALLGAATCLSEACGEITRAPQGPGVLVFAAASLKTAFDQLGPWLEEQAGTRVRVSYAATSALARQIESGAPATMFVSADLEWMDYLAARELIQPRTRVNLLGNRLVLIAPAGRGTTLEIAPGFALRAALRDGRLSLADPSAVPAGRYARAALTRLGVWASVSDRLASAENVRAALLLVSRGEAPLGIVYETDARAEPGVSVVDIFPAKLHPPIVYVAALTSHATDPSAHRVLAALRSPAAGRVFAQQGFRFLPD